MENLETGSIESDVSQSTEGSSEPSTSSSSVETQSEQGTQEASPTESQVPFHEHPRFKELISQKNEQAEQIRAYQEQLRQFQGQLESMRPKTKTQEEALLERLKGIDPEFGSAAEKWEASRRELEEFKAWKQNMEIEQGRAQAVGTLEKLYNEHKISDDLKSLYQSQIESIAYNNPQLKPSDLGKVFKQVHDQMSKWSESFERKVRSKYVTDVRKEAAPATQTGGAPAGIPAKSGPQSLEDVKQKIVDEIRRSKQKI